MAGERLLYLCSNGIAEPLVESQVLAYLRRLRPTLSHVRLVTLDRTAIPDDEAAAIRDRLAGDGIAWTSLRSHPKLGPINPWLSVRRMGRLARRLHADESYDLCHARSFLCGLAGDRLRRATGVPLINDMRGFWIREKRAKGSLRSRWLFDRLDAREWRLAREANHVVSLTHDAKAEMQATWGVGTPITVIPCNADLDRFATTDVPRDPAAPLRLISVGSLGAGYLPQAVFDAFAAALRIDPNATLDVVTRQPPDSLRAPMTAAGVPTDRVTIRPLPPSDVPAAIAAADVALCMVAPSDAKIASFPVKVPEYLACGKPIVSTTACGDVDAILTGERVGVPIDPNDPSGYEAAIGQAIALAAEPGFAARARRLAEDRFSADVAAQAYRRVYDALGSRTGDTGNP